MLRGDLDGLERKSATVGDATWGGNGKYRVSEIYPQGALNQPNRLHLRR